MGREGGLGDDSSDAIAATTTSRPLAPLVLRSVLDWGWEAETSYCRDLPLYDKRPGAVSTSPAILRDPVA